MVLTLDDPQIFSLALKDVYIPSDTDNNYKGHSCPQTDIEIFWIRALLDFI